VQLATDASRFKDQQSLTQSVVMMMQKISLISEFGNACWKSEIMRIFKQ